MTRIRALLLAAMIVCLMLASLMCFSLQCLAFQGEDELQLGVSSGNILGQLKSELKEEGVSDEFIKVTGALSAPQLKSIYNFLISTSLKKVDE